MEKDLKDPIKVPFSRIYLDPNNPRIAMAEPPGYDDPGAIFDDEVQAELTKRMEEVYDVSALESAVEAQGWVPIDAILVWEHPQRKGRYIVVEGNTRTTVLRKLRTKLESRQLKLDKIKSKKKGFSARDVSDLEKEVAKLRQIVADTEDLTVYPVNAKNAEELEEKLPRLLGVRHITHAQQWSPYATNLYILSLYQRLFTDRYGDDAELTLEDDLIKDVSAMVSLNETKARRNIQAASAFSHFKREYEDELPDGEQFSDEDQYFFELILQNPYPRQQFEFGKNDLELSPEMEEVLFKWAFAVPRVDGEENQNKLYKAESIRMWNTMKKYDDKHSTTFASQFDVENPDTVPHMRKLEAEYLAQKAQVSPVDTVEALLTNFGKLKADTLMSQSSHLKPMLEELQQKVDNYLRMIDAVAA
ncbi:MAG TPA: hypothetical protein VGW12_11430 [Pyrinomonadaceae bacterium]|nr:hypothetical protein [Pyrinomonadaceae bacterium]